MGDFRSHDSSDERGYDRGRRNRSGSGSGKPGNGGRRRNGEDRGERKSRGYDRRKGEGSGRGGREERGEWKRDGRGRGKPGGNRRRGGYGQRGGRGRDGGPSFAPRRPGYREERHAKLQNEPDIPADVSAKDLDRSVLQDLRSLAKDNADTVARHMVMAATLMADDPKQALRHARAAKERAGRVSVVRETAGIAAYQAGEWREALSELRAARRISGGPGLIAAMADCERGLGRPDKALEIGRDADIDRLNEDQRIELAIVLAGAHLDQDDALAAVAELERENLEPNRTGVGASRLFYAYADALLAAGRTEDAKEWFERTVQIDEEELLDAEDRLQELRGE